MSPETIAAVVKMMGYIPDARLLCAVASGL
jgi:hypothetical protein